MLTSTLIYMLTLTSINVIKENVILNTIIYLKQTNTMLDFANVKDQKSQTINC